jgi:RimJ/RimL family protein N-acetyltransferase
MIWNETMPAIDLIRNPSGAARVSVPIRTQRLLLRPFEAADVEGMTAMLADPDTTRWIGGVKSAAEAAASVMRMQESFKGRGWGTLAVIPAGTSRCVGYCGVRPLAHTQEVEIAFGLSKDYWQRGLGTEASRACIDATFRALPLDSIVATVYPDNGRSIAVLKKLGMKEEARVFGVWPDSLALLFRITRADWARKGGD